MLNLVNKKPAIAGFFKTKLILSLVSFRLGIILTWFLYKLHVYALLDQIF